MTTEITRSQALGRRSPRYQDIADLLDAEVTILDHRRYDQWLELLAPELTYRCAALLTVNNDAGPGYTDRTFHYDETLGSLKLRIERLATGSAWAEDPPSRVRRFVTSVQIAELSESELEVTSNLLLTRIRLDWARPHIVTCERRDVWRRSQDSWALRTRDVLLDQTSLATENLSFFL
jgi:3-phenylpropionate/cinnamic acid dioxygenase small subunit